MIGLCVCNREFMKQARDREMDDGHIILLNRCGQHNTVGFRTLIFPSMSGHRVVNSGSTHFYCATKYAVTAITEGLRQELREIKSGIRVTVSTFTIPENMCIHTHTRRVSLPVWYALSLARGWIKSQI